MPSWKKVIVSGSDALLNSVYSKTFISASTADITTSFTASGFTYPTVDLGEDSFLQSDGNGNLTLQYVNTIYESIYNAELTTIQKGTPLYVSGAVGAESKVYRADASNPLKMPVTYIAADNIDSGQSGRGVVLGLITGVDTTGYPPGTEIYVAAGGGWTSTRPTGSNIAQLLGIVTKEGNGGQGLVLNPGPMNIPNLLSGQIFWGDATNAPIKKSLAHILSGSSYIYSGSFSGSFQGDGSNLTGIQVSSLQSNFNVTSFTNTGSITINHNLNATYPIVQVYDSTDNQFLPQSIEVLDSNNVKITFVSNTTGNVVIGKGGDIIDLTQIVPATTRSITGSFSSITSTIITHSFDTENVLVQVYDNLKNYILPDNIQILDNDRVQIDFTSPTTGYAVLTNGGHVISGSLEWGNILNIPNGIVSSSSQIFPYTGSLEVSGSIISQGDILPYTTDIYSLGSPTKRWGDVYLTSASIYLNNTKISATNNGYVSSSFTGSFSGTFVGDGSNLSSVFSMTQENFSISTDVTSVTVTSGSLPSNKNNIMIYYNGQFLNKTYITSISSNTLNFNFTASLGDKIDLVWINQN